MGRWLAAVQVKLNGQWLKWCMHVASWVPKKSCSAKVNRHRAPILISSFVGCVGSAGVSHQSWYVNTSYKLWYLVWVDMGWIIQCMLRCLCVQAHDSWDFWGQLFWRVWRPFQPATRSDCSLWGPPMTWELQEWWYEIWWEASKCCKHPLNANTFPLRDSWSNICYKLTSFSFSADQYFMVTELLLREVVVMLLWVGSHHPTHESNNVFVPKDLASQTSRRLSEVLVSFCLPCWFANFCGWHKDTLVGPSLFQARGSCIVVPKAEMVRRLAVLVGSFHSLLR